MFEALIAAFIALIAACFFANFATTGLALPVILAGLVVPSMPPGGAVIAMGTLGANIMPHNLYLHSGLVKDRAEGLDRTNGAKVENF